MEIMIVLAIIGLILGVLVLPKLLGSSDKAKKRIAKSQVDGFALSYEEWSADHPGEACPGSLEELVNQPVKGKKGKKLEGKDPWGMPFKMVCGETAPEGVGFGVMSYGGDKKEGGNDDIKSWD